MFRILGSTFKVCSVVIKSVLRNLVDEPDNDIVGGNITDNILLIITLLMNSKFDPFAVQVFLEDVESLSEKCCSHSILHHQN